MAALRNSGWQPYSVKIGNRWVSYQRFEPISLLVGAAADFAQLGTYAKPEEADRFAMSVAMAVAQNITSKTWLSGLSDFFDALSDPKRSGERLVQRMASTMAVPAIVAHAAGAIDPYLRESHNILGAIRARVPGLSQGLPARLTVWGDPIKRGDSLLPGAAGSALDFVSPLYTSTEKQSPLLQEVARLRAALPMPQRTLRAHGLSHKLTPEQYREYVEGTGKPAREYLEGFVRTDEWRNMDDDAKRTFLHDTLEDYRAIARGDLKAKYPELDALPPDGPTPPAGAVRIGGRGSPPMRSRSITSPPRLPAKRGPAVPAAALRALPPGTQVYTGR
jgi:hypothetical protein